MNTEMGKWLRWDKDGIVIGREMVTEVKDPTGCEQWRILSKEKK